MTEIKLPMLGESVESATVVSVLVKVGSQVAENQTILEVDTEKAAVEVPASAAGAVKAIHVKPGDVVKVGQVLITLEDGAEAEKIRPDDAREQAAPSEPPPVPEAPAKSSGPPPPSPAPEDDQRIRLREAAEEAEETPRAVPAPPADELGGAPQEPEAAASPLLRRMARELGVDINEVKGAGPGGRISEDDLRNYARSIILNASGTAELPGSSALPDFSRWGAVERKPMTSVRRKTAEHLQHAWSIPHVTQFDTADITDLEELRRSFAAKAERAGGKLTVTAIALKVVASALKVFPQFNASLDLLQGEIIEKRYIHIGVAVDTNRGLLVPVIRDVDKKNTLELSVELAALSDRAREGKLTLEEMQGGVFTITSLGGIGGSNFTPIINSPELAILGISRSSHQVVFREGQITPRLMLPLALSYDHRGVDGADAARFLRWIAEALERPFMLMLEG